MADDRVRTAVKITDPLTDANEANVDASGNLQVIAAANTGVDIGDVDVTSVVPGTAATSLGKAENIASAGGDVGVAAMVLQDAALSALASIDGDYTHPRVDANGALWTHDDVLEAAIAGSELQVDIVAELPAGTQNIGDVDVLSVIPGTAATNLGKAQDVASAGGDVGVAAMAVQDAALTALGSIDGDYAHLRVNANGALHVTGGGGGSEFNEDAASAGGELGALALGYRQDGDTSPVTADGDYHGLIFDATGNLKVNVKLGGSEPTPTNPTTNTASSSATAAGASADLDSAEITEAEFLWQVEISSSVPFKAQIKIVEDAVPRNISNLMFGKAGETIIWKPPHRNFAAHVGSAAGLDVFRATVFNMDNSQAADLHAAFHYST